MAAGLLKLLAHAALAVTSVAHLRLPVSGSQRLVRSISPRDSATVNLIPFSFLGYLVTLEIGSPPQPVDVILDTGSNNLWVSPLCTRSALGDASLDPTTRQLCADSRYDPRQSSTASGRLASGFYEYGIGSANVSLVNDTIHIPGTDVRLRDVTFGVATESTEIYVGILGTGISNNSAVPAPTLVDQLLIQGLTRSRAYGLGLGVLRRATGTEATNGSIIFGGVDVRKYSGDMFSLPLQETDGSNRFAIALDGISTTRAGRRGNTYAGSQLTVVIDSGSTLGSLPRALLDEMVEDLGGAYFDGYYQVPCSITGTNSTFDFAFNDFTARVPFDDFILQVPSQVPDVNLCILGASPADTSAVANVAVLGGSFMREIYSVFDQDGGMIHMAEYHDCGENIIAFTDLVPDMPRGECRSDGSDEMDTDAASDGADSGSGEDADRPGDESGGAKLMPAMGLLLAVLLVLGC